MGTPETFDGTVSKSQAFLSQLALYFLAKSHEMRNDKDKIIFALSYMKGGTAGPWAELKVQDLTPATASPTWDAFVVEFKAVFGDSDPAGTARHKMDQLRQGSLSADEYVAAFRELKKDTGYNDTALIDRFEKGLNSSLVDKIYSLPAMPTDLAGWIEWSTKLDRQWRQRETKKKSAFAAMAKTIVRPSPKSTAHAPTFNAPSFPKAAVTIPDVVPMEVDSGWKKVGRPIICYKCRKPGHIARNCPSGVDINAMDFDSLKAYMKDVIQKEEESTPKEDF